LVAAVAFIFFLIAIQPTPQALVQEKEALGLILNKHGVKATDVLLEEVRRIWPYL
jgi:hypothetical protein